MEKRPCISAGQIFSVLFISKIVISMTYGSLLIGDSDIWDHLVSAVVSIVLTFLIIWASVPYLHCRQTSPIVCLFVCLTVFIFTLYLLLMTVSIASL